MRTVPGLLMYSSFKGHNKGDESQQRKLRNSKVAKGSLVEAKERDDFM